jgi:hypothetical protein
MAGDGGTGKVGLDALQRPLEELCCVVPRSQDTTKKKRAPPCGPPRSRVGTGTPIRSVPVPHFLAGSTLVAQRPREIPGAVSFRATPSFVCIASPLEISREAEQIK